MCVTERFYTKLNGILLLSHREKVWLGGKPLSVSKPISSQPNPNPSAARRQHGFIFQQ